MVPTPADSTSPHRGASITLTVAAKPAELRALRTDVGEFLRASDASTDVVETFELAVSELATNVIQHTTSSHITVNAAHTAEGWALVVSDADQLVALPAPSPPDPEQLTGRGLFIVQTMMDEVTVVDVDGHHHIRCLKRG